MGSALIAGPALIAVAAPGPFTLPRLLTALIIAGVGAILVLLSLPKQRRVVVDRDARAVSVRGAVLRWTDEAAFRLVPVEPDAAGARPRYGVAIVVAEGAEPVVLVAADDPAEALSDLEQARRDVPLAVQGGWGLPDDAPWIDRPPPSRPPLMERPPDERTARRRTSTTLLVGAVAIAFGIGRTVQDRLSKGQTPNAVSLLLPGLGVMALLVLAGVVRSAAEVQLGDELVSERRFLGLVIRRTAVRRAAIRRAYLVSPDGGRPMHLLVATESGVSAFPCEDESVSRVQALLS